MLAFWRERLFSCRAASGQRFLALQAELGHAPALAAPAVAATADPTIRSPPSLQVSNASVQHIIPSVTETSEAIVEETFRTNVFPIFYLAKHAVPAMPRGASIIVTTSVVAYQVGALGRKHTCCCFLGGGGGGGGGDGGGLPADCRSAATPPPAGASSSPPTFHAACHLLPLQGSPLLLEYSATKGAQVALVRSLSQQLAPKGIRVNGVAPGPVWTPLNPATRGEDNLRKWLDKEPPLGRIGQVGSRPWDWVPEAAFSWLLRLLHEWVMHVYD